MRGHRAQGATVLLGLAACGIDHRIIEADIPQTVTHVAVLELDTEGEILSGSPLRRIHAGEPFGLVADSPSNVVVVGYSAEQLAPYDVEGRADAVDRSALRRPESCAPRLPAPEWTGLWNEPNRIMTSSAPGPIATSDFLTGLCPDLSNLDISIDQRCSPTRCSVARQTTAPCRVDMDLADCGLEPASVTIDALGELCVDWGRNELTCKVSPGIDPALEQLECGGEDACRHDLYVTLDDRVTPFESDTVTLFEAPPFVHTSLRKSIVAVPRARIRYTGYAFDQVILGNRILVVAAHEDLPEQECVSLRPRRLFTYDVDTLALVSTTTVPPCLTQMLPDPGGDGFLGTFAQDEEWHVGRFDALGNLLGAKPVDPRVSPGTDEPVKIGFRDFEPADISLVDDSRWMAVLFDRRTDFDMTPPRSIITLHDPTSMELVARHDLPDDTDARSMTAQGDQLVLASPFTHRILWIDALSGVLVDEIFIGQDTLALSSFSTLSTVQEGSLLLVGVTGGERSLLALSDRRSPAAMIAYDRDVDTFDQISWPSDPARLVVGGIAATPDGDWAGVIAFAEPGQTRFLPNTWEVGPGLVSQLESDEDGRVFALLPWVPALVRLTPRP